MASLLEAIEIKRKMFFEFEDAPYHCLDVDVSKPTARGGQTLVRLKMRNLLTRAVFDRTFKAGDKFKEPDLVVEPAAYLYSGTDGLNFMDQETFETFALSPDMVGDDAKLLADNLVVQIQKFNGRPNRRPVSAARRADGEGHRTRRPRRHGQRRRNEDRDARDRVADPCAALHQGRRKGARPHRDARIRWPRVG
jgi:translation elongation factor P/translation initiation factor 5A